MAYNQMTRAVIYGRPVAQYRSKLTGIKYRLCVSYAIFKKGAYYCERWTCFGWEPLSFKNWPKQ